jgi:hypothetical protein
VWKETTFRDSQQLRETFFRRTAMSRKIALVLLVFLSSLLSAQTVEVKLKIRAALYDRDLNVKPVPRLAVKLAPLSPTAGAPIALQTSLDGVVEAAIRPGKYHVSTEKGVELFDKSYRWDFDVELTRPENMLELSNDNAKIAPIATGRETHVDELATQYKRVKEAIVTVWTEDRAFDGTIIDPTGLVLTVQHQLEPMGWLAVQLDDKRKLPAVVVASDPQADVAVLRFDAKIAGEFAAVTVSSDPEALVEGERLFTVENPGKASEKKLLTGVLSKADADQVVCDIKLGYVGSPLFNSSGNAVGIVQFRDKKLQIKPIGVATKVIKEAMAKAAEPAKVDARMLPVLPEAELTTADLRSPGRGHWEKDFYQFKLGDFFVEFMTPVSTYEARLDSYNAEMKEYGKHPKGKTKPEPPGDKYPAALMIAVFPQTKVPFMANFGRPSYAPVVREYKNGFSKMTLLCGEREVEPVWPHRITEQAFGNWAVVVKEESSGGRYVYRPEAITPECGKVTVRVVSTKNEQAVLEKVLDEKVVQRLWEDFEAYRSLGKPKTEEQN